VVITPGRPSRGRLARLAATPPRQTGSGQPAELGAPGSRRHPGQRQWCQGRRLTEPAPGDGRGWQSGRATAAGARGDV